MPDAAALAPARTGTLMAGKRGLVMGVANDRSIAWGIAKACASQGAEIAFTYQGEALERRVRPLAESVGGRHVLPCDVTDDASVDAAFGVLAEDWGGLDFLVHAIGFADKNFLRGRYLDTPREAFLQALDISCYSFVQVCQRAVPLMRAGGSLLTMSYLGAERVTPHYNVMGGGEGGAGSERAIPGRRPGGRGDTGERDFGRADQDAGGERDRRLPLHPEVGTSTTRR